MRRRRIARSPLRLMALGAFAVMIAVIALLSLDLYGPPPPAPPSALDRVAEKNRRAAVLAAANQRAESAAAAQATDALVEANLEAAPR